MTWISSADKGVCIQVLVVPRASRTQILGIHDDRVKIKLMAPPVDGKANKALIAFLAKRLNLTKDRITIVTGEGARRKTVLLIDACREQVEKLVLK